MKLKTIYADREFFTLSEVPTKVTIQGKETTIKKNNLRYTQGEFIELCSKDPAMLAKYKHFFVTEE
ncbi:hypothetical protein C7N43_39640 [Sphingobacteriales bacterium UPWRP_1]|nr:hypothetical protein C7N43_39640 [Sphingobacteriales bacterium UPWRP_1]